MRSLCFIWFSLWAALAHPAAAEGLDETFIRPGGSGDGLSGLLEAIGLRSYQKSYALIVGISDFEAFTDLPTQDDPLKMQSYLIEEAGFDHVHILTGDKVTKARLEELMIDEFRPLVGEEDRFLFYWSGHGVTLDNAAGEVGFLPLQDSDPDRFSSMVAMDDIRRWDRFINARHILYLLDSCFSGLAGAAPQSDLEAITKAQLSGPARHMLTAGRGDEQTIAIDALGGSVFTHAVLKGLRGAADAENQLGRDGLVSVGELKAFVGQEVALQRNRFNWNKSITPQLRDMSGSDGAFYFPVAETLATIVEEAQADGEVIPQGGDTAVADPQIVEIQQTLVALGFDPGAIDGQLSFTTRRALIAFQNAQGLELTGAPDDATQLALLQATLEPPEPVNDSIEPIIGEPIEAGCDVCPKMVSIPGGPFTVGRDNGRPEQGPAISVEIAPFMLSETEITQADFAAYVEAEGLDFVSRKMEPEPTCYQWTPDHKLRKTAYAYNQLENTNPTHPVSCVSFEDAIGYINWLNNQIDGPPFFRLPNEAEFEFALTRGMVLSGRVDGDIPGCALRNAADASSSFPWKDSGCVDSFAGVAPAGTFVEDGLGLYDMSGNLWEWVEDCWTSRHIPPEENRGFAVWSEGNCDTGTLKGASFDDPLENLHPTVRQPAPPTRRQTNIGFRLARDQAG